MNFVDSDNESLKDSIHGFGFFIPAEICSCQKRTSWHKKKFYKAKQYFFAQTLWGSCQKVWSASEAQKTLFSTIIVIFMSLSILNPPIENVFRFELWMWLFNPGNHRGPNHIWIKLARVSRKIFSAWQISARYFHAFKVGGFTRILHSLDSSFNVWRTFFVRKDLQIYIYLFNFLSR